MAKKVTTTEIKKLLKAGNVLLGTERTLKSLRLGRIEKVLLSSNVNEKAEKDINYYAGLSNTEVQKLDIPNDELGVVCKKPFSISVISLIFLWSDRSSVRMTFLTNCWVRVDVALMRFLVKIPWATARIMLRGRTPRCSKNFLSSVATTASIRYWGI